MNSNIEIVKTAKDLLVVNNWNGEFTSFLLDVTLMNNRMINENTAKTRCLMQQIMWNLNNIYVILEKLEWTQNNCQNEYNWMNFARIDIEYFFVQVRSIMDYVAQIVYIFNNQISKKRRKSFEKIHNWVNNPSNKLNDEELSQIIKSTKWFSHLRDVRNNLIHNGGYVLVFIRPKDVIEPKDGILFKVFKNIVSFKKENGQLIKDENGYLVEYSLITDLFEDDSIMYNTKLVCFNRFSAVFLSYLLLFLESFAKNIRSNLHIDVVDHSSATHMSFKILIEWMDIYLSQNKIREHS